jgi:hypothetical protein
MESALVSSWSLSSWTDPGFLFMCTLVTINLGSALEVSAAVEKKKNLGYCIPDHIGFKKTVCTSHGPDCKSIRLVSIINSH